MTTAFHPTARADGQPLRVLVLLGGPSAERAVSLESGAAIAAALKRRGYAVTQSDIAPDALESLDAPVDVVFPALHGTFGEDGQLQTLLEQRGLAFVGSGAAASALAIDKVASKRVAQRLGIDVAPGEVLSAAQLDPLQTQLRPPVVVKPIDQGSSVLTRIVRQEGEFAPAVRAVIDRYGQALVEQFVPGDEFTVGLLGHQALPPICIRPRAAFYDYHAKYQADDTEYLFDTGRSAALVTDLQARSLRMFEALGCRHLGRCDWIVDAEGRCVFLEMNTMPGFTTHSLLPMAARQFGLAFDALVEQLVAMAWQERP